MDYIKIRFGDNLERFASRMDRTLEEIFRPRPASPMFTTADRGWVPSVDVYETPEEIIVRAEIAGVDKEALEVEINSRAVRIAGVRREMSHQDSSTYRLAEIQYGPFERVLYLPSPIDTEVVGSDYTKGFLQLRLVKVPTHRSYRVPVTEG
jgi:HSP20 family protein